MRTVIDMKRLLTILLAVILILTVTACKSAPEPELENNQTDPSGVNVPSESFSTEPPELKIVDSTNQEIEAALGTYQWNWDKGDGNWTGVCADSAHPLEWKKFLVPLVTSDDTVELKFAVQPQYFTISCWSDEYWGDTGAPSECVSLTGNTLELKGGGCIYEVIARWNRDEASPYGDAIYGFYVIKDDHTHTPAGDPQTVDDPVTGYCGNTMTTIILDEKEHTFMGSDSVYLTDILINLKYDPMRVCRCAPEFTVKTEFGEPYGVNLAQRYARCEEGQADLTEEQIERIYGILDSQT